MGERSEPPSGKKLAEARSRGQVARSVELNAAAAMLMGFWLLGGPGAQLVEVLQNLLKQTVLTLPTDELTGAWLIHRIVQDGLMVLPALSQILLTLMATGIIVTVSQTGLMWAEKNIGFDLSRLNPLNGLKRIFSVQGLIELLRALLKLLVVGWAAYNYLNGRIIDLLSLGQTDLRSAISIWANVAYNLGLQVGGAYLVLALADYMYQRWNLMRTLKMTKEEVKEEFKQQEGDPMIKGKIRERARRMARMRMMKKVPQAEVVITNPTHFAVALEYKRETMRAPRVVAKGAAFLAQRIREIARENQVPVIENPPVARALYSAVELEEEVPPELYVAVAEIFAFVYNVKSKRRPSAYSLPALAANSSAALGTPDSPAAG